MSTEDLILTGLFAPWFALLGGLLLCWALDKVCYEW